MSCDFDAVDYFTEPSVVDDPYPYFDWLRSQCPVHHHATRNVVTITGYAEAIEVMRDNDAYSRCNTVGGPLPGLPVEPSGDDITELIERYRHLYPLSDHVVTLDPPEHERHRHLLTRLITPRRLRENEEFLWRLADREIDTFLVQGRCEFVHGYAEPYATLTIADILGVPESDHANCDAFDTPVLGNIDGSQYSGGHVTHLEGWFTEYMEDRRRSPTDDTLTKIAHRHLPRRLDAPARRGRLAGNLPVRRRTGHDSPPARRRPPVPRRGSRAAGGPARGPAEDPELRRRGAPAGERHQGGLPAGAQAHRPRRCRRPGWCDGDDAARCLQP